MGCRWVNFEVRAAIWVNFEVRDMGCRWVNFEVRAAIWVNFEVRDMGCRWVNFEVRAAICVNFEVRVAIWVNFEVRVVIWVNFEVREMGTATHSNYFQYFTKPYQNTKHFNMDRFWSELNAILLLWVLLASPGFTDQDMMVNPTLVPDKGALCLSGIPAAYYFAPGVDEGSENWLVFLQINETATPKYFSGILSNNPEQNPDFYNWNKVMIRYCDGSSFTGNSQKKQNIGFTVGPMNPYTTCVKYKNCTSNQITVMQDLRLELLDVLPKENNISSRGLLMVSRPGHEHTTTPQWYQPTGQTNETMAKLFGDWYYDKKIVIDTCDHPYGCT
nr:pectin acetylesterase 5 [Ipomoea batatas]